MNGQDCSLLLPPPPYCHPLLRAGEEYAWPLTEFVDEATGYWYWIDPDTDVVYTQAEEDDWPQVGTVLSNSRS